MRTPSGGPGRTELRGPYRHSFAPQRLQVPERNGPARCCHGRLLQLLQLGDCLPQTSTVARCHRCSPRTRGRCQAAARLAQLLLKVVGSSCAIQPPESSQRHCVQSRFRGAVAGSWSSSAVPSAPQLQRGDDPRLVRNRLSTCVEKIVRPSTITSKAPRPPARSSLDRVAREGSRQTGGLGREFQETQYSSIICIADDHCRSFRGLKGPKYEF